MASIKQYYQTTGWTQPWTWQPPTNEWTSLGLMTGNSTTVNKVYDAQWMAWNITYTSNNVTQTVRIPDEYTHQMGADTFFVNNAWTQIPAEWYGWNAAYVETEEERLAYEEQERIRAERMAEQRREAAALAAQREEERAAANARAEELLMSLLDAQQKRDILEHGWFEIISNKGRRWRIRRAGIAGNVDLMPEEGDVRLASYCAHPPAQDGLPYDDHYIAQMLSLQADEESFTNVAYLHHRAPDVAIEDIPMPDRVRQQEIAREQRRREREEHQERMRRAAPPLVQIAV